MNIFIWFVLGLLITVCLSFVSFSIAQRWNHLFLCGLIGVAIYMAIPAIYAAHSGVKEAADIFWGAVVYGGFLSFFTVIMPVLTVDYLRFKERN